jgi:GntR family transcriptional regulator / MocR family aminotransferase
MAIPAAHEPASGTDFGLLVELDRTAAQPLADQLASQLRDLISSGGLPAGTPLPPSRLLAADLVVSRGVIVTAYEQLRHQGWLISRQGAGTRVASPPAGDVAAAAEHRRWDRDLHPEVTDVSSFPRVAWRRAFNAALAQLPTQELGYRSMRGIPQLREELASYLARVRRVVVQPDQIVICAGLLQAIGILRTVLGEFGVRGMAFPRISHPALAGILGSGGPPTKWLDVDENGVVVEQIVKRPGHAVIVNPIHHYPLGISLAADRAALLADSGLLIVEEDSNAELCHDGLAPPALQSRAPERTVHIGSLSRALAPALRLGWIAAPPEIARALARVTTRWGLAPSALEQATLAGFIASGDLDRHLRGLRRQYRRRARALAAAFTQEAPELRLRTPNSGFHALLELEPDCDEDAVVRAAAERSIRVFGLGDHVLHGAKPPPALVFGYAMVSEGAMPAVAAELRKAVSDAAQVS